ncbi:anthranilate phosphoribosyltransferase [Vibrio cincinnatiensis]|jgi:anthranilate phosphoribosyltransferase|uniref:Anthranilate phosphoribosyltransferase n=1 Tax=Vibrio cincinnatiensis DSM 19608 TaxID=1123491 RepID=A0A1T4KCJ2_VIBCI|nr:anthranilate phosphoribosyltransferase [Vibrio cincinnatiensis]MCG3721924.1 anthranilate phosphoribosyltransferase [Vibrio cincinnatiensis]MCG3728197.1 anthranilate phosphoribosyltransferase [Vibrio cincinnatiensis]MCG3731262.1 anthranilate phosphoribosyltransferase [Vibrio cincinnatiensis]MCG3735016.1 anthranilate phosphoribosyltransferase [Vibrio cincinnatiensis]MCG3738775.1 anthranilate phosphoribosyltransferase [Vibrio cincinnatiensis]
MQHIINKLYQQQPLSQQESETLFTAIIRGECDSALMAAALTALKIKGETPAEIVGAVRALLANAEYFPRPDYDFADIVGTGGDGANTINISTTSAFVAAACGIKIAKHGNRGVSSQSGSSDLLDAFGINMTMSANDSRQALDDLGVAFLFAPQYHGGVRHAMPVRQSMKTRTIFNILGPLINPARPNIELMGVYSLDLVRPIAETMLQIGMKRAAVVHGSGLDEVAIHGETHVAEIKDGKIIEYTLTPADFGLDTYPLDAIQGGTPQENRAIITNILTGKGTPAQMSAVAINVALLLRLFGFEDLTANAQRAMDVMNSGKAYQLVQQLAERG